MALQQGLSRFIILSMFVQGFSYGSYLVQNGKASSGDVMTVFWCCITVADAFHGLSPQIVLLRKGQVAVKSLLELMETSAEAQAKFRRNIGLYPHPAEKGDIVLRNVVFQYPTRAAQVLEGFNMNIISGKPTFIVGQSGSGKSTLSSILLKLYSISSGAVFINGMPLETLSSRWIFDNIHVVEQQSALFDISIADNIRMGSSRLDQVSLSEVETACKYGLVDEFLHKLERGLETQAGTGGSSLSGGQRQRVALARAYISNAPIMIFDESVSALDANLRQKAISLIRQFRQGKTTIIITHELSQIEPHDYVYLVHNGKVAQHGTRKNLQETGLYEKMAKALSHKPQQMQGQVPLSLGTFSTVPESLLGLGQIAQTKPSQSILRPTSILGSIIYDDFSKNGGDTRTHIDNFEESEIPQLGQRNSHYHHHQGDEENQQKAQPQISNTLWKILKNIPNKRLFHAGVIVAVCNGLTNPLFSYAFSKLWTGIIPTAGTASGETAQESSIKWGMIVLAISAIDGLTTYLRVILDIAAEKWLRSIRQISMENMIYQDMTWFSSDSSCANDGGSNKAGSLSNLIMNEAESLRLIVTRLYSSVACVFVLALTGSAWSLAVGWKLALVGLSLLPGFYLTSRWYTQICNKWESIYDKNSGKVVDLMNETLGGIKTVKVLALERHFTSKFENLQESAMEIGFRKAVYIGLGFGMSQVFTYITQGLLLWYGMKLISNGEYDVEQTMMVFTLQVFSLVTANQVFSTIPQVTAGIDVFTKVSKLLELDTTNTAESTGDRQITGMTPPNIQLLNVSFSYGDFFPQVLRNLSFSINAGQVAALVGPSGSGKSTIAAILTRLYEPTTGRILLGNEDISQLSATSVRQDVAIVHQMPLTFLSQGTIRQNLEYAFGEFPPHPVQAERLIRDACLKVGILDFILQLDHKFDTEIGTGANNQGLLSGGQLQRLGVARALLRRPKILILDECTSALDPESVAVMQSLILEIKKSRSMTVLIITHQKEMCDMADKTITLGPSAGIL